MYQVHYYPDDGLSIDPRYTPELDGAIYETLLDAIEACLLRVCGDAGPASYKDWVWIDNHGQTCVHESLDEGCGGFCIRSMT